MQNKGYSSEWKALLKDNNDIVSVISKYVNLNKKGKLHWGCCPFHIEKTPSFAVNESHQYYHCFGCGEHGDVISFIEKIESVDFMEAIKILAENANMELPEFTGDENIAKKKAQKDLFLKANRDAAIFYNKQLYTTNGKKALDYLYKRGLNKGAINKFGLGASPDWTSLGAHLNKLGYKNKDLVECGLLGEKNNRYYDLMAERLMFPIINSRGEVLGFSARALDDGKFAKYRNTAQTIVFDKSRIVYGINLLKALGNANNTAVLVEGQMDVIAMHSAGFENAVACMGTALTSQHAKELKRFVDKVIIAFDGDSAGVKATLRSLDLLADAGLDVRVVSIPEKLDPDEYIKKYGKDKFKRFLEANVSLNDYKIESVAKKYNLKDNAERSKFVADSIEVIKNMKSEGEKEVYLKVVSAKSGVGFEALKRDLKLRQNPKPAARVREVKEDSSEKENDFTNANFRAAEFILAYLLHNSIKQNSLNAEIFTNNMHKQLYEKYLEYNANNKTLLIGNLFDLFDTNKLEVKRIIDYDFRQYSEPKQHFIDCKLRLEKEYSQIYLKKLLEEYKTANSEEEKQIIKQKINEVTKLKKS